MLEASKYRRRIVNNKRAPMKTPPKIEQKFFPDNQNRQVSQESILTPHNRPFMLNKKERTACDQATD
jgi:hypothetical protein